MEEVPEDLSSSHFFSFEKNFFKVFAKFSSSVFGDIIGFSYCPSVDHNPELRCVIYTGVTLFALVLHLNCTAHSQSESSNFFMYIIKKRNRGA